MNDKFKIITETSKEFDLEKMWNDHKDEGIVKLFLHYDYNEEKLTILGSTKNSSFTIKESEVDYFQLCVILTNIIQTPFFITSNTEKPETITVEFGDLK